jgi:hypothetical protein
MRDKEKNADFSIRFIVHSVAELDHSVGLVVDTVLRDLVVMLRAGILLEICQIIVVQEALRVCTTKAEMAQ